MPSICRIRPEAAACRSRISFVTLCALDHSSGLAIVEVTDKKTHEHEGTHVYNKCMNYDKWYRYIQSSEYTFRF